jgi:hypothetical protein
MSPTNPDNAVSQEQFIALLPTAEKPTWRRPVITRYDMNTSTLTSTGNVNVNVG